MRRAHWQVQVKYIAKESEGKAMQVCNKLTGVVTHVKNNDAGINALIKLGILEVVAHDPGDLVRAQNGGVFPVMDPPATPQFVCGRVTINQRIDQFDQQGAPATLPAIIFTFGSREYQAYTGDPKDAQQFFAGRHIPEDVFKQYAKAYKG